MATVVADTNSAAPNTIKLEEEVEADHIESTDYFFFKIGESLPLMSDADASPFDTNSLPASPLAVSEQLRLLFVAHTSGFCVAKIKDVVDAAKEIKEKGTGPSSVQSLSVVDVPIGRAHILALSSDSSILAAVVGPDIHFFSVHSLLHKDQKPIFSCSVDSNYVKDMLWTKETGTSYIVLTDNRKLQVGAVHKPLKDVMDEVDAVARSVDGNFVAVARKNSLSIFDSEFKELLHILLPDNSWMGDSCTIKVDTIRWIRSDSVILGCVQQTGDGEEENYFVQVITCRDGKITDGSAKLAAVYFSDLFPYIVDEIVPFGSGPHLFINYLEHCEVAFVSNRKNTDEHVKLFAWSKGDTPVSIVDIETDTWLPRIELPENGDDNLVLGLCIVKTIYEKVKVKIGVEEEKELLPHCLLVCLTLEGKLIMFNVGSIAGSEGSSPVYSTLSDDAHNVPRVEPSDLEGPSQLEERAKQSSSDLGSHELNEKKTSFQLDEVLTGKVPKRADIDKYITCGPNSDENLRKESVAVNNEEKAVVSVETRKAFGHSEDYSKETSDQFSLKNLHVEGSSSLAGDTVGFEKWKTESHVSLPRTSLGKDLLDISKSTVENIRSSVSQSTSVPTGSHSSLSLSGVSISRSLSSPSSTKSTLSGSLLSATDTVNKAGSLVGNFGSRSSNSFDTSIKKAANQSQQTITCGGVTETPLGISSAKVQPRENVTLQSSIGHNAYPMKGNQRKSSPFGQLNSEQKSSQQFCNVQNMANELDKLLECIEEAGGFRDVCTNALTSTLKSLEEGMKSLSNRSKVWQGCMEERFNEIQLLLDKTVQVLARKTHMEGLVRQTTDGQYWDLWNRQKLSSEFDLKRLNVLNLSQELINQMVELEKHFNILELNLFGESSGVSMVSRAVQSRHSPSRYMQSLHAIHNAMISQLAAAQQLSEVLSRQMALLSIKSPPANQETIKKQLFESIGISYPGDSFGSPTAGKVIHSPSVKNPLVSCSGAVHNESKRSNASSLSSRDPETARRRRDSLDRNWANFEAPKTTVKRMLVDSERQKVSSFSLMDKQLISPSKLEGPIDTHRKVLTAQDRNGCKDSTPKELNYETATASIFKWSGATPAMSNGETERSPGLEVSQGNRFSAIQDTSASSASFPSFMDPNMKNRNSYSTAERPAPLTGHVDKSESAWARDFKPFASQFSQETPAVQSKQPQLLSSPIKFSQMPVSDNTETESTKPAGVKSSVTSTYDAQSMFSTRCSPINTSFGYASSLTTQGAQTLPVPSVEDGSGVTSAKIVKDTNNRVLRFQTSASPVSPSPADVSGFSSNVPNMSSINSASEPPNIEPQRPSSEAGKETSQSSTSECPPKLEHSANHKPSSPSKEVPEEVASTSPHDVSRTEAHVSSTASEKPAPPSLSDSGGPTGGKSIVEAAVTQEDEMEEEAPETNQATGFSLGTLAGFGIGSTPSATPAFRSNNNPFGSSISSTPSSSVSLTVPSGELFRPASFSFQSLQAPQQSQPGNIGGAAFGTFGSGNPNPPPQLAPSGGGFGQPASLGSGQAALGSVLGSFGQSRQPSAGLPGMGFGGAPSPGGFMNAPTGGGFAGVASTGGGFAGLGTTASGFAGASATVGGGFAAAATGGGGFGAAATSGGGFAAAATSGGGFAAAASGAGGFGAFSKQGTSGFSGLGSGGAGGGRPPPSELFTQIRK